MTAWLEWGRRKTRPWSEQTLRSYDYALRGWAQDFCERGLTDPRDVTSADVEAVIASKTDWNDSTKTQRLNALSSFYKRALKTGAADRNAVDCERPPRTDNEWPMILPEDFRRMRALGVRDVREDALLLTLALTGVRHDELLGIDLGDLIPNLPGIGIKKAKGGKKREVPLSPVAAETLRRYLPERPSTNCPALFLQANGKRLTKRVLSRMWHRWLRDAGLADSGYVVHSTRVTFNTLLAWAGFDRRTVEELMGHGTRRDMNPKYTRTDMPRKVWAVATLESALLAPGQGVSADGPVQVASAGVQVSGGCVEPGVPEHLTQRVEVATALQHETRERMPQVVQGAAFGDP
ncbi:MAG: hypothetical protein FJX74_20985, partial [Armatimonadetes bacterium]|nr:hypothetical protein [Armatimonadota bacterium]